MKEGNKFDDTCLRANYSYSFRSFRTLLIVDKTHKSLK